MATSLWQRDVRCDEHDPIRELLAKEKAKIVVQRVATATIQLCKRDQSLVRLAVLEQRPLEEIAAAVDLSVESARRAVNRARKRLGEALLADPIFRAIAA